MAARYYDGVTADVQDVTLKVTSQELLISQSVDHDEHDASSAPHRSRQIGQPRTWCREPDSQRSKDARDASSRVVREKRSIRHDGDPTGPDHLRSERRAPG